MSYSSFHDSLSPLGGGCGLHPESLLLKAEKDLGWDPSCQAVAAAPTLGDVTLWGSDWLLRGAQGAIERLTGTAVAEPCLSGLAGGVMMTGFAGGPGPGVERAGSRPRSALPACLSHFRSPGCPGSTLRIKRLPRSRHRIKHKVILETLTEVLVPCRHRSRRWGLRIPAWGSSRPGFLFLVAGRAVESGRRQALLPILPGRCLEPLGFFLLLIQSVASLEVFFSYNLGEFDATCLPPLPPAAGEQSCELDGGRALRSPVPRDQVWPPDPPGLGLPGRSLFVWPRGVSLSPPALRLVFSSWAWTEKRARPGPREAEITPGFSQ